MSLRSTLVITNATKKHTSTLIFLHGSGGSGADLKEYVEIFKKPFAFPHIKIIYPSASVQYYEPYKVQMPIWFNRPKLEYDAEEYEASVKQACLKVEEIVNDEVKAGIPRENIVIGGFSMGGGLSLYTGYYSLMGVGGIYAISSFLPRQSAAYKLIQDKKQHQGDNFRLPVLFQGHGDNDDLIPLNWGQKTCDRLKEMGVNTEFKVYKKLGHEFNKEVVSDLVEWLYKVLPEN